MLSLDYKKTGTCEPNICFILLFCINMHRIVLCSLYNELLMFQMFVFYIKSYRELILGDRSSVVGYCVVFDRRLA